MVLTDILKFKWYKRYLPLVYIKKRLTNSLFSSRSRNEQRDLHNYISAVNYKRELLGYLKISRQARNEKMKKNYNVFKYSITAILSVSDNLSPNRWPVFLYPSKVVS